MTSLKNIPSLRHYLRLQRFKHPADDFDSTDGKWVTECEIWGHVATTRAEQRVQNALVERAVSHTITTRWHHQVPTTNEALRLVDLTCDSKIYNVQGWTNLDEANEFIEWETTEMRT